MEFYDSFVRITFDPGGTPIILLDYGDALWGPIEIDGGQVVQEQSFVRAAGIKVFPRGNERHTLRYEKAGIEDTLQDSFAGRLNGIIALPRGQASVRMSLEDGRYWTIANCAIGSWPGGMDGTRINRQGVEITGGALTASP